MSSIEDLKSQMKILSRLIIRQTHLFLFKKIAVCLWVNLMRLS